MIEIIRALRSAWRALIKAFVLFWAAVALLAVLVALLKAVA